LSFPLHLSPHRVLEESAAVGPVLGIDTSGPVLSVGIVAEGRIAAAYVRSSGSHCAELPAGVEEVLDTAGLDLGALNAVAVATGPGSFTGLRVGLSYAKGIAVARSIAIAGISSLDALALCAGSALAEGAALYPVIDARRGEVYTGLYRFVAGALQRESGDLLVSLRGLVTGSADEAVFVGYSMAGQVRSLAEANGRRVVLIEDAGLHLRGSFVAALGALKVAREEADVVATLQPLYLRPPDTATDLKPGEQIHGTPRGRTYPAAPRS
jgi:tRNA threonylcarbamoyladenosine biosynthesis protein TsaB